MFICTMKFDKKKAVFYVIMAALIVVAVILLASTGNAKAAAPKKHVSAGNLRSEKDRIAYLAENGWEAESPAVSEETVVIPRSFSKVFENYNDLQKQQGFDLSQYCGMEVKLYTYRVADCELGENVLAVLYVYDNRVIGGDVHSTALDGFMRPLRQ